MSVVFNIISGPAVPLLRQRNPQQAVVTVSAFIHTDITGPEIHIFHNAMGTVNEVQGPPPLIAAMKVCNMEALHIGKEDHVVFPDGGQTVLQLGLL